MLKKQKTSWAKGPRKRTCLVRLEPDVYEAAKEEARKDCMPLIAWVSLVVRGELMMREL